MGGGSRRKTRMKWCGTNWKIHLFVSNKYTNVQTDRRTERRTPRDGIGRLMARAARVLLLAVAANDNDAESLRDRPVVCRMFLPRESPPSYSLC